MQATTTMIAGSISVQGPIVAFLAAAPNMYNFRSETFSTYKTPSMKHTVQFA